MLGNLSTGARDIPSLVRQLITPHDLRALQPRFVLATRHPSVVAIGIMNSLPSSFRGPTAPSGIVMYPMTLSAQAPITIS